MGVVTLTLDDEVEERLREFLAEHGGGKGALGNAVSEAVAEWLDRQDSTEAADHAIELMEQGFEMGEPTYETRAELHGDRE